MNIRVVCPAAAEVQVDHHLLGAAIQTQVRGTAAGSVACHRCCVAGSLDELLEGHGAVLSCWCWMEVLSRVRPQCLSCP